MMGPQYIRRLLVAAVLAFALPAAAQLSLKVTDTDATAVGLSEGADTVFIGVLAFPTEYHPKTVELRATVPDTDRDGSASVTFDQPVYSRSVVFAIDTRTGAFAYGSPEGFSAREDPFPIDGLRPGSQARTFDAVELHVPAVQFFFIRPAVGIWLVKANEGAMGDEDSRHDGKILLTPEKMTRIWSSGNQPAPKTFSANDLLVGIDPIRMVVFSSEVKP